MTNAVCRLLALITVAAGAASVTNTGVIYGLEVYPTHPTTVGLIWFDGVITCSDISLVEVHGFNIDMHTSAPQSLCTSEPVFISALPGWSGHLNVPGTYVVREMFHNGTQIEVSELLTFVVTQDIIAVPALDRASECLLLVILAAIAMWRINKLSL